MPPADVRARLSGRGWELMFDYLMHRDITLAYTLTDQAEFSLYAGQLRRDIQQTLAFGGIQVADINYDGINLELDLRAVRTVPIVLQDSLRFASGYHLKTRPVLSPDSVELTGPASKLNTIEYWATELFQSENIKSDFSKVVALRPPPPEITLSVRQTTVEVVAEQFTEKSIFVPLQVRHAPDSLKIFPEMVKLTCTVGLSMYKSLKASDFGLEIDLAQVALNEGKNTVPIRLVRQPEGAMHIQFTPKSAAFFILKKTEPNPVAR